MSGSAAARAADEQLEASDPRVSAFVDASAGSGKTKVLTDRLLRLMLDGADPARIQCLTFTKAAAAEMSVRLQRMLGAWVTLPDAVLDGKLHDLRFVPTAELRAKARALFARVLDLPGGMRIGTIHAFCQSLLRRFPLEAALSPHFQVLESVDELIAWRDAREAMLAASEAPLAQDALTRLAGQCSLEQFGHLVTSLQSDRERLARAVALGPDGLAAAQRRALGLRADSHAGIIAAGVTWPQEAALRDALAEVQSRASTAVGERAGRALGWLGLPPAARAEHWRCWTAEFLAKDGKPRAPATLVNDKLANLAPALRDTLMAEQARIIAVEDQVRALELAHVSAALLRLAAPVVDGFAREKDLTGKLDYADMIGRTVGLLRDPGTAWVLFKLDGGLDHLLLDEVQDTSPEQWSIAHALVDEFFAGSGARETTQRTIFAVGDGKQSIYSFQGADLAAFTDSRRTMKQRVEGAGATWRDTTLDVSFRSAPPVLHLVDKVFSLDGARRGVVIDAREISHVAYRAGAAGCVELWPLVPSPPPPEPLSWTVPERNEHRASAPQELADALARWIKSQIGTPLASQGRPLAAGDVLILVRRRHDLSRELVRALKVNDVPVAGLDRMVLTAQPAVADLLALCDTLLLPEDDLSLACVLTSPIGGLSDDSLMRLAMGRDGSLWSTLGRRGPEQRDWRAAWEFLHALLSRVDYATPHALLAEALGPRGKRAALLARLGHEAAEPIDELLSAALIFATSHPPSLQGFLHWLRQSGAEVKREPEGAGGAVRIMTVHGAKGLQAPLVILPDTTSLPPSDTSLLWARDPDSGLDIPLWVPRRELRCAAVETLRLTADARRLEEYNRLLYVALTRAEDRLLVCGHDTRAGMPDDCWYDLVQKGFSGIEAPEEEAAPFPQAGPVRRLRSPQTDPVPPPPDGTQAAPVTLPGWAGAAPAWRPSPPPREELPPRPLAPSRPQDAANGPVPHANSPLAVRTGINFGLRRGQLLHALLQHLPDLPHAVWHASALEFLARPGNFLTQAQARALAHETVAILEHPEVAPLFGPDSRAEVPLTGRRRRPRHRRPGRPPGRARRPRPGRRLQNQPRSAGDNGKDAGAIPAPDGGVPRGAARHLPRVRGKLRPGVDAGRAGVMAAIRPSGSARPARRCASLTPPS